MESRADQYRRLAEECLALSRLGGFSMGGRLNLLEMAGLWNRLADQHEKDAVFRPVVPADKPAVQQVYHDVQMHIGQQLRLHCELPHELPDRLLTLLMELTGREENG